MTNAVHMDYVLRYGVGSSQHPFQSSSGTKIYNRNDWKGWNMYSPNYVFSLRVCLS